MDITLTCSFYNWRWFLFCSCMNIFILLSAHLEKSNERSKNEISSRTESMLDKQKDLATQVVIVGYLLLECILFKPVSVLRIWDVSNLGQKINFYNIKFRRPKISWKYVVATVGRVNAKGSNLIHIVTFLLSYSPFNKINQCHKAWETCHCPILSREITRWIIQQ